MSRDFFLAFGGTGARCAEAFAYLLASRAVLEPVQVLIVDPDQSNGNVDSTRGQYQRYDAVQRQLRAGGGTPPFFSTPVNAGKATFFWSNASGTSDWRTLLEYELLSDGARDLIDLLYDEEDLGLKFEKGYIGRAHIGSLDLLQTLQHGMLSAKDLVEGQERNALQHFYTQLRSAAEGGKDRPNVIVVGSIFGGTGASGLPAVPPLLREALGDQLAARINVGCVQVAPYFSFPEGTPADPDSALHPLATQTAMRHYAVADVGYHRIYMVGASQRAATADHNNPGGSDQRNKSHPVELAAALAAAHFFAAPIESADAAKHTALLSGSAQDHATWTKLPFGAQKDADAFRNLVALATFCVAHLREFAPGFEEGRFDGGLFMRSLAAKAERTLGGHEPALIALTEFATRYLAWIHEVQAHTRAGGLFTLDPELRDDSALRVARGGRETGEPISELKELLDTEGRRLSGSQEDVQTTGIGFYVQSLTASAEKFCSANYRTWS